MPFLPQAFVLGSSMPFFATGFCVRFFLCLFLPHAGSAYGGGRGRGA